jgi:cytochrome c oxidase subunit 2
MNSYLTRREMLGLLAGSAITFAGVVREPTQALADEGHAHGVSKGKTRPGKVTKKPEMVKPHQDAQPHANAPGEEHADAPQARADEGGHGQAAHDETIQGHQEAGQGHEETPDGREGAGEHGGHGHGKEAFSKYGLVKSEKGYKEFNLKLKQFAYEPNVLRVSKGDRVKINIDSVDVTHGFYLDGYGINQTVPEREQKTLEFVANQAGAFRFRCSSTCGAFHPFMIGKLVVGSNVRQWAGLAALILAPFAFLSLLFLTEGRGNEDKE